MPRGWPLSALLLAGLLSAGCAGPTYSRLREADEKLSSEATRALREDAVLARARLDARAYRGVVGLFGKVETGEQCERAAQAIRRLAGVRRINNLIVVAGDSSAAAPGVPAPGAVALIAAREAPAPTP
jgi:BON domain-containing protein